MYKRKQKKKPKTKINFRFIAVFCFFSKLKQIKEKQNSTSVLSF